MHNIDPFYLFVIWSLGVCLISYSVGVLVGYTITK